MYFVILFFLILIIQVNGGVYEGETCDIDGKQGVCRNIRRCEAALKDIRRGRPPLRCSFDRTDVIVCCLEDQVSPGPQAESSTTFSPPVATTTRPRPTTTAEYIPPIPIYTELDNIGGECEPIPSNMTSQRTGRKAWDKCIEYQEKYVYPCQEGVALSGDKARGNLCGHNADELVIGGEDAKRGEFPHMALLGFGNDPESAIWGCGGTLISEKFVLTAGHCTSTKKRRPVRFIRLGVLQRNESLDPARLYEVGRIIKHPQYNSPNKYNDIALLESTTIMQLNQFAVPACLPVGNSYVESMAVAIGFGAIKNRGLSANTLQKVKLSKFSTSECSDTFPVDRLMKEGFLETTQMCYGDKTISKDTCQGDSGGPLHVNNKRIHCMFVVIGVTSFGNECGFVAEPAIYTKVSAYTPWIESIVWPA